MGFSLGWYYMRMEDEIGCVIWKWRQMMGSCRGCLVGGIGSDFTKMMRLFGFMKFKRNLVRWAVGNDWERGDLVLFRVLDLKN